jgi:GT2 family glycosyltransferase
VVDGGHPHAHQPGPERTSPALIHRALNRTPVTVVVVHRDAPEAFALTVDRLRDQDVDLSLIVVDNASDPAALAAVRAAAPEAEIVMSATNLGFGPALNIGLRRWLRRGVGEWVAVVPHDALPDSGVIAHLVAAAAARAPAGLVSADVGDQAVPRIDRYFGAIWGPATVAEGWDDCDYPHGTLFIARRECLAEIGIFDERYFAYNDEADLGARAREGGWEVGLVRSAMVANPSTATPTWIVEYLRTRNTILLVRDHGGRWPMVVRLVMGVGQTLHHLARPGLRAPWFVPRARFRGLADAFRGRFGPPPHRRQATSPPSTDASRGRTLAR